MDTSRRIDLRAITADDAEAAVGVLSRGMRDNPGHVAAFGENSDHRESCLVWMFRGLLRVTGDRVRIGAFDGGTMVGFAAGAVPGKCRLDPVQQARAGLAMMAVGPARLSRVLQWQWALGRHHPGRAHHHFGPIAVDRDRQGQGIGSMIMKEFARRWDESGEPAYLVTDKPENVSFYTGHGFAVIDEGPVLGRTNWFMWRG